MASNRPRTTDTIFPVILPVPESDRHFTGRQKVAALSRYARDALAISAAKSGVVLPQLPKDHDGVPLPIDGNYWSLTHKSDVVGAVVSGKRIGIDIEKLRPCSPGLFRKTAREEEWALSDDDPVNLFFRYWTAKESVLKASGTGVKDLLKCRVVGLIDSAHLTIEYRNESWAIAHLFFNNHIASVTQHQFSVEWTVEGAVGKDEHRITPEA